MNKSIDMTEEEGTGVAQFGGAAGNTLVNFYSVQTRQFCYWRTVRKLIDNLDQNGQYDQHSSILGWHRFSTSIVRIQAGICTIQPNGDSNKR